jgi:hypothetical protein
VKENPGIIKQRFVHFPLTWNLTTSDLAI